MLEISEDVDHVLVRRVLRLCNPWRGLGLSSGGFARAVREAAPQQEFVPCVNREPPYDLGRVHFFMDELQAGRTIEPIELDNRWMGSYPVSLVLIDGHHRLLATALLKLQTIPCYYSGVLTALEYLKGQQEAHPFG